MPITYPLSLPADPAPSKLMLTARAVVAISESPFTGQQQVQEHQGQWWEIDVTLPPMPRATAEEWVAFWLKLNGRKGTFLLGDVSGRVPRGTIPGTPLVNGAVAVRSASLPTKGWTPSQTGVLKAGDYLQLGTGASARLHKNLSDANSDGAGNATLDIWPSTRVAYADAAPIVVTSTVGVFRMASNDMPWTIGEAVLYGVNFGAREAI